MTLPLQKAPAERNIYRIESSWKMLPHKKYVAPLELLWLVIILFYKYLASPKPFATIIFKKSFGEAKYL